MRCRNIFCDSHKRYHESRCDVENFFKGNRVEDCERRKAYDRMAKARIRNRYDLNFQWLDEHDKYYGRKRGE